MKVSIAISVLVTLTIACAVAEEPVLSPTQEEAVNMARTELASVLGVAAAEIALNKVNSMVWPNSSLGCPEKGMMYLDVITSGFRVEFRVGGNIYHVHTTDQRAIVCFRAGKANQWSPKQ